MKDLILTLILIISFFCFIYITLLIGCIFIVVVWALSTNTPDNLFMGEIINWMIKFNIKNPAVTYTCSIFSIIFIAYKIKHEKNKK